MHGSRWKGRGEEGKYIYQKGYQHGQAIQLLSVIMLHDLRVTVCVCSEGSALFHIISMTFHEDILNGFQVTELQSGQHCNHFSA